MNAKTTFLSLMYSLDMAADQSLTAFWIGIIESVNTKAKTVPIIEAMIPMIESLDKKLCETKRITTQSSNKESIEILAVSSTFIDA